MASSTTSAAGTNGDRTRSRADSRSSSLLRSYGLEIGLISFAALLLEISYTRIISFKLFYYYTYLVIGLALLGLGTGGVLMAVSSRLKRASTEAIMLSGLLLGAVSVVLSYLVLAQVRIASLAIWDYKRLGDAVENLGWLVVICLALFSSFVAIGIMIATLFSRRTDRIARLYFSDLLGAGLACAVVVYLLQFMGPVATVFVAAVTLAGTGTWLAWRLRGPNASRIIVAGGALTLLLMVGVVRPSVVPEILPDEDKVQVQEGTELTRWRTMFRIDAQDVGDRLLLNHDGLLGSVILNWDGERSSLDDFNFDRDIRAYPYFTPEESPEKVMIIGAAGGHEILASLFFDAEQVDAIELNPATYDLVTDDRADYAGHLADQPGVNYVNGDGRSYLARGENGYQLIWYPATDSYSASNAAQSGAYVLSESYLYTTEAIEESLDHLADDGIIAAQFGEVNIVDKPNRTTRYVSTARAALESFGVEDPSRHVLVNSTRDAEGARSGLSTVLIKRTPFTDEEIARFGDLSAVDLQGNDLPTEQLYAPGDPGDNPVSQVMTLPSDELDDWYKAYPYDVDPVGDDAPFFWHFARFGSVVGDIGESIDRFDPEVVIGERVLLLLLVVATFLAAVFLLVPFVAVRPLWSGLPRKRMSAVYFAALGFGFMFFEISLIQRLVLFLGYPTYSLTVTLASILLFTGVGAFLSRRYNAEPERALRFLLPAIVGLGLAYLFGLPALTDALLTWPIGARMIVTFVLLAPLGICLGTFMPVGLGAVARITDHSDEYVAWGWAVNGFASVIGSVMTTLVAMRFGFNAVIVLGVLVYLVALAALRSLLRTGEAESDTEPLVDPARADAPAVTVGT